MLDEDEDVKFESTQKDFVHWKDIDAGTCTYTHVHVHVHVVTDCTCISHINMVLFRKHFEGCEYLMYRL